MRVETFDGAEGLDDWQRLAQRFFVKPHEARAALELIHELGLSDQVIGSNDALRVTYVRKGGRLVALPDGLMMMVPTKVLPLAATSLLVRAITDAYREAKGEPHGAH